MTAAPDIGTPPELAWLPVDRCYVDPGYQRSLETPRGQALIAKIAGEFSWPKFGALMATPGEPDPADPTGAPRWLIIDGQHRHAGASKHGGIGHVPAVVHKDLSRAEQAAAFVGANRDRVQVYAQQIYRAQLLAGEAEAITLERLAAAGGIRLLHYPLSAKKTPAGSTAAVPALRTILRVYGEAITGAAIAAIGDCLRHQPGGLRAPYFQGAALYLKAGGSPAAARAALNRFGVRKLEQLAERLNPNSAAKAIAEALARAMPTGTGPVTAASAEKAGAHLTTAAPSKPNGGRSGASGQQPALRDGITRRGGEDGRSDRQAEPMPKPSIGALEGVPARSPAENSPPGGVALLRPLAVSSAIQSRLCHHCWKPMRLRQGEGAAQYQARDYCDAQCRHGAERAREAARKAAEQAEAAAKTQATRSADQDEIARFIAEKGVTKVPPAFAAPSQHAALPPGAAAERLKHVAVPEPKRPGESMGDYLARLGPAGG